MKKLLFVIVFIPLLLQAQGIKQFEGNWKGDLYAYSKKGEFKAAEMKLNIETTDSLGVWKYQMIYGDKDVRNYKLRAFDEAKNKYAVDEGNNIILTEDLIGSRLISCFEVQNSLLVVTLERKEDTLIFEVISLSPGGKVKSGSGTEDSPFVYSYPATGFQRCILKK